MSDNPLYTIMHPSSVVVAGASNNVMKMGSIQAQNLVNAGYKGEIYFLHPTDKEVLGHRAYPSPDELPIAPELALLVTPAKVTPDLIDKLGKRGTRHAVIVTAGFREVGGSGPQLEADLVAAAARHDLRFIGPNCIGILNTNIGLNLTVMPYADRPGRLSMISQSGTYVAQLMPYLRERGIRYSQALSVGNSTNIDLVDCLEYLGESEDTAAIIMYIEEIRRGRLFLKIAREVARHKPLIALYVGGTASGARSGLSHTGSLGAPDTLIDGIFEQAGVIRARTVEQLFEWGHTLAVMPVAKGNRIAILTHSGGPATSMADFCDREGLALPPFSEELQSQIRPLIEPTASARNPVDLTFSMEHKAFVHKIPKILFHSDEIDGILIHGMMDSGFAMEQYDNIKDRLKISKEDYARLMVYDLSRLVKMPLESGKPLVTSSFLRVDHASEYFRENDIPVMCYPEAAVLAMSALVRYGAIRRRLEAQGGTVDFLAALPGQTAGREKKRTVLDEFQSKRLLAQYGVPIPHEYKVKSLTEAKKRAAEVGYPIVLKGLPEGVAHKTEAALVHLGITSTKALHEAWWMIEEAAPHCPRLLAGMVRGGRELVVGMTRHRGFGPCVMLGLGGILTEAIRDVTFRAVPVSNDEAREMPDSLRLKRLFDAQRGMPEIDRAILATVITGVGKLALDHPEITEIDINPLIVFDGKPIAVDALVVMEKPEQ